MTAAEAKRAYMKEWRSKNRDRIKANNARYWERKAKANSEREKSGDTGKGEGETN